MSQVSHRQCEDCGKIHRTKFVIWFKGKWRCGQCKHRAGISMFLPDPVHPPKTVLLGTSYGYKKKGVVQSLPDKEKPILELPEASGKVFNTNLTPQEHKTLWNHFYQQGLSDEEIDFEINKIREQVKKAHEEYKKGLKENKPSFKEEFEKLVAVRK